MAHDATVLVETRVLGNTLGTNWWREDTVRDALWEAVERAWLFIDEDMLNGLVSIVHGPLHVSKITVTLMARS